MTGKDLFDAIDGVDDALLADVYDAQPKRKLAPTVLKIAAAAAAIALCAGVAMRLLSLKQEVVSYRTTISDAGSSGTSGSVCSASLTQDLTTETSVSSTVPQSEAPAAPATTGPTATVRKTEPAGTDRTSAPPVATLPSTSARVGPTQPSASVSLSASSSVSTSASVSETLSDGPSERAPSAAQPTTSRSGGGIVGMLERLFPDLISPMIPRAAPPSTDMPESTATTQAPVLSSLFSDLLANLQAGGLFNGSVLLGGVDLSSAESLATLPLLVKERIARYAQGREAETNGRPYYIVVDWVGGTAGAELSGSSVKAGAIGAVADPRYSYLIGADVYDAGYGWYFAFADGKTAALIAA